jgi:hypothetical protein
LRTNHLPQICPSTAQQKYVSVGQEVPLNHGASDCSRINHSKLEEGIRGSVIGRRGIASFIEAGACPLQGMQRAGHLSVSLSCAFQQGIFVGGIPGAYAVLLWRSVAAGKTGAPVLRSEMLDGITAVGDGIRTGIRDRLEWLRARANNQIVARPARLPNLGGATAGGDPAAIPRLATGERDQSTQEGK